MNTQKFLVILS